MNAPAGKLALRLWRYLKVFLDACVEVEVNPIMAVAVTASQFVPRPKKAAARPRPLPPGGRH